MKLGRCIYPRRNGGIALIIVLTFLVLISALVIAFFSSVTTELTDSNSSANGATARQLADSTVQIAMSTVRQATASIDATSGTSIPLAWASQPGMIRTYDNTGAAHDCYKLYSSDNMLVTQGQLPFVAVSDIDTSWYTKPAQFTDLNAPVLHGTTANYPIVDPTASENYPSTGANPNGVRGFTISATKTPLATGTTTPNPVPMPVKWLYVLSNGQVTAPTGVDSTGKIANWTGSATPPTAANPIVGRIAFWTDDDTCKVNINTAAGDVWNDTLPSTTGSNGNPGSFWDVPRVYSTFDRTNLALYQPAQNEFQRFPGHPATTYISAVFPYLTAPDICQIAPRVTSGGSLSGTAVAGQLITFDRDRLYSSVDELLYSTLPSNSSTDPRAAFNPTANGNLTSANINPTRFFLTAHSRAPEVNLFNQPRIVMWPVAAIPPSTVWSQAISSIPVTEYRTPYDSLFAYCGTLHNGPATDGSNDLPYFFQRGDSTSPVSDLPPNTAQTGLGRNRGLINYLRFLTSQPIPGFGATFPSTAGGGMNTFLAKYPRDRDQILTEIFDYIRSTNTQDVSVGTPTGLAQNNLVASMPFLGAPYFTGLPYFTGSSVPPASTPQTFFPYTVTTPATPTPGQPGGPQPGQGQIVPITDDSHSDSNTNSLRGFGRFPTVREASVMFVGVGQAAANSNNPAKPLWSIPPDTDQLTATNQMSPADTTGRNIAVGNTRVQATFFLNFFDPSQGYAAYAPNFQVRVSGLDGFTWSVPNATASSMKFASSYTVKINTAFNTGCYGGWLGASMFIEPALVPSLCSNGPLVSTCIDLPTNSLATPTTFSFSGGGVTVQILDPTGSIVLQTLNLTFPGTTLPVPELAPYLVDTPPASAKIGALTSDWRSFSTGTVASESTSGNTVYGRFFGAGIDPDYSTWTKGWVCGTDVVRSIEATTDYRTVAATKNVALSTFLPLAAYSDPTIQLVHSLGECENGGGLYAIYGYPNTGYTAGTGPYKAPKTYAAPPALAETTALPGSAYGLPVIYDFVYGGTRSDGLQPMASEDTHYSNDGRAAGINPAVFGLSGANAIPAFGVYAGTNLTPASPTATLGNPPGDWDTGFSYVADGPFINKADEGNLATSSAGYPYYDNAAYYKSVGGTFFSPNRMIPSPVMFGSLPTGVNSGQPWQTLLFRPNPGGTPQHIGSKSPPDYLLLDLFNMPVVQPYPISDPFSTAGKINMNYQIVPFTYIGRDTAMRAVLRSEQILALPTSLDNTYKSNVSNMRYGLDLDQTLVGFTNRFNTNDIFRSASEICGIWLVPAGQGLTYNSMPSFWAGQLLTGDNVRERPYADIYPRLTTKSNTYTVHYRVQTLKSAVSSTPGTWTEGKDLITAEYRGSSTFERYLDTGDYTIPDYATADTTPGATSQTIDAYYKFRVIETKQFTP
jgi:uncharacterized protein (TIGR02600 family)